MFLFYRCKGIYQKHEETTYKILWFTDAFKRTMFDFRLSNSNFMYKLSLTFSYIMNVKINKKRDSTYGARSGYPFGDDHLMFMVEFIGTGTQLFSKFFTILFVHSEGKLDILRRETT